MIRSIARPGGVGAFELGGAGLGAGGAQQVLVRVDASSTGRLWRWCSGARSGQPAHSRAEGDRPVRAHRPGVPGRAGDGAGRSSSMVKSSRVNPPGTAGRSGLGLITVSCPAVPVGGAGLPAAVGRVAVDLQPRPGRPRALRPVRVRARAVPVPAAASGSSPGPAPPGVPVNRSRAAIFTPFSASAAARPGGHRHLAIGDQPGLRLGGHVPAEPVPARSTCTCGCAGPRGPRC